MTWNDYKNPFYFKSSKHFKDVPNHIKILNITNMDRKPTNLRLIQEKSILETNNLNINNGIFQGNLIYPLFYFYFFCIDLIFMSVEL